jgi:hypothetical protein
MKPTFYNCKKLTAKDPILANLFLLITQNCKPLFLERVAFFNGQSLIAKNVY